MRLCKKPSIYLFRLSTIVFVSFLLISCGTTIKYQIYSGQPLSPENAAILEEDLPEKGRCWTLLIDEEDVHAKSVNFWSLKSKNSRAFEVLPGIHTIVVVTDEVRESPNPPYSVREYALSPISMTFKAEGGHKYLIGGEIDGSGRWRSWIKDTSSGELVSKAIASDPRDGEVIGRKCRVDSNYIISSIDKNNILYIPGGDLGLDVLSARNIQKNPAGTVIAGTIYKTMESGRWQYKKAYLVRIVFLFDSPLSSLILVASEGLKPDDNMTRDELLRNKRVR